MINLFFILPIIILVICLYFLLTSKNYFNKLIYLAFFQTAIIWIFIMIGKKTSVIKQISNADTGDALPQVLMLTAIVIGFTTIALGLTLIIKLKAKRDQNH